MATSKLPSAAAGGRVRSAFAVAEHHASVAASGAQADASAASAAWSRPALLKLPSQSRSEQHHWASNTGDMLFSAPSCTPQVETFRSLQTQFSHPEKSPQVTTLRRQQEDEFRSPLTTPQVRSSRLREEGTFRAPPSTPQVDSLRSAESSFRTAPSSTQSLLLRTTHEDPFRQGLLSPGFRTAVHVSGSSLRGPAEAADQGAVLSVRQHMDSFRSEPITPTLVAIRDKLEAFISDKGVADGVQAAFVRKAEDPFAHAPSFRDFAELQTN